MLLLLLAGAGVTGPVVLPVRAYAALSFSLVGESALDFSLVTSGDGTISAVDDAEGSVS
jgi:hypothetical protein